MAKKFKVKLKYSVIDMILYGLVRIFKRKPAFYGLDELEMEKKCLMIGNHNGAGGPFTLSTFMNKRFMSWGAHQMCEGYRSRWGYLYRVFYMQKLGYSKTKAFISATLFGLIAGLAYHFAGIIPVYFDMRIKNTFTYSMQCLDKDVSVFVFPENSDEGYKDQIDEMHPGFLHFAKVYYRKYKTDLPIYTVRYDRDAGKRITIGKPLYFQELLKTYTEQQALEIFRLYLNSLKSGDISYDKILEDVKNQNTDRTAEAAEDIKTAEAAEDIKVDVSADNADSYINQ